MKRRSQQKPKRDHELEQVKKLTTVKLTTTELRDRLLADKAALEARLKELFQDRRTSWDHDGYIAESIKGISEQLRSIKSQLKSS